MAKIAIVVIPFWGHINPTLSVGKVLLNRGHQVTWFLPHVLQGLIIPKGGDIKYTNSNNPSEINRIVNLMEACKSKPAFEGVKYVMENVLMPLSIAMYKGLSELLDEYKPDLIVHDEQTYVGAFTGYEKQIPVVTTHAAPSGIFEEVHMNNIKQWYFSSLKKLQNRLKIVSSELHYMSNELGLVFCPKLLNNPSDKLSFQKFVGPCIDVERDYSEDFDFSQIKSPNKKNVLVSIGTLLSNEAPKFYNRIVNEFKDCSYNIIVTTNPEIIDKWPQNFIVSKRIPYLEVLRYVDVVITHGGANTVCDSIGLGIPLVVIPMAYDQYYLGDQIAENKLGFRFRYKRLKDYILRQSVDQMLESNNIYKQNVDRLSRRFKEAGGANKAAEYIEDYIKVSEAIVDSKC